MCTVHKRIILKSYLEEWLGREYFKLIHISNITTDEFSISRWQIILRCMTSSAFIMVLGFPLLPNIAGLLFQVNRSTQNCIYLVQLYRYFEYINTTHSCMNRHKHIGLKDLENSKL